MKASNILCLLIFPLVTSEIVESSIEMASASKKDPIGATQTNLSTRTNNRDINLFLDDQFERQLRKFADFKVDPCDNLYRMVCPANMSAGDTLVQLSINQLNDVIASLNHAPMLPILWHQAKVKSKPSQQLDQFDLTRILRDRCLQGGNFGSCIDETYQLQRVIAKWASTAKLSFYNFNSTTEKAAYAQVLNWTDNLVVNQDSYTTDYKIGLISVLIKQIDDVSLDTMTRFYSLLNARLIFHKYAMNSPIGNHSNHVHRKRMVEDIVHAYVHRISKTKTLSEAHQAVVYERLRKANIHVLLDNNNETLANMQDMSTRYSQYYWQSLPVSQEFSILDLKMAHAFALANVLNDSQQTLVLINELNGVMNFMAAAITHTDISIGSTLVLAGSYNVPQASLYGFLGSIIGHEVTHIVADKNDTLYETELRNKMECLENHYTEKCELFPEMNGCHSNYTVVEDFADFEGIDLAYQLFEQKYRHKFHVKPYKGIHLTYQQLFFVSWAQIWCQPLAFEKDMVHTAHYGRVNIALSQQKGFRDAFKCRPTSRLGLESSNQCSILH